MKTLSGSQFKSAVFQNLARVAKALASPSRLELLDILVQGPRHVEALAALTSLSVANASQHLRILLAARLVETEKRGLFVTYRVADDEVADFLQALRRLAEKRIAEIGSVVRDFLQAHNQMEKVDRRTLLRRVKAGEVMLLDVRPAEEFRAGHLPGATSIPLPELRKRLDSIPRGIDIVAYCRGPYCVLAVDAVAVLRKRGFRAIRFEDGVAEWRAQGGRIAVGE